MSTLLSLTYMCLLFRLTSAACNCPIQDPIVCNKCICEPGVNEGWIINCKNQGLIDVPTFTSSPTATFTEITLAGNNIVAIPGQKFQALGTIKKLDITANRIQSIDQNAFSGLGSSLEELLLEADGMTNFPKAALSILTNLKTLSMTGFDWTAGGITSNALSSLNQLRVLSLPLNRITSLAPDSLSGQTTSLKELNLEHNSLTAIPTAAITQLQNLEKLVLIAAGSVTSIGSNALQIPSLKHLDLSQNGLNSLSSGAFNGLENSLEELNMKICQLQDNKLPPLKGLRTLKQLDISQNGQIANIADNFFSEMTSLENLKLSNNGIHTLRRSSLAGLNSLKELDVSENGLVTIATDTFQSTPSLEKLELENNANLAAVLTPSLFNPLISSLQSLSLEKTNFGNGNWGLVKDLASLQILDLTDNQISALDDLGLVKLKLLETIKLDKNSLTEVTQRGLHGPNDHLLSIQMNNNGLTTVPECAFHDFTQINFYQLGLNNNPLHCDCHMKWLLSKLKENPDFDFDQLLLNWICSSPSALNGRRFTDLNENDLVCSPPVAPPTCLDLSPTTTPATSTSTSTTATPSTAPTGTPDMPRTFTMNITEVEDKTMLVKWFVSHTDGLAGFRVEYWVIPDGAKRYEEHSKFTREARLNDLNPLSEYYICVIAIGVQWLSSSICDNVKTLSTPGESKPGGRNNTLIIALACSLGGLVIIAVILIVVFVRRSQKKKKEEEAFRVGYTPPARLGVTLGYDSKRFSKPRANQIYQQNKDNMAFETKLEGFSKEERDRILGLVSQHGASTISMISNASSHRYVRDPLPARPRDSAYMNPQKVDDELDRHIYCEIPGEGAYNEIADSSI